MRWIIPEPQADMKVGDMLPSGLALYTRNKISQVNGQSIPAAALDSNSSFKITNEFLRRWASILTIHPFEERESLTERPPELDNDPARPLSLEVNSTTYLPGDNSQPLYVERLTELQPGESTDWNRPFWEGKSIVHVDLDRPWQSRGILLWMGLNETHDFGLLSPLVTLIAMLLTGVYGGVHMVAWGWSFPTFTEELLWKLSCFLIMLMMPSLIILCLTSLVPVMFLSDFLENVCESRGGREILERMPWFRYSLLQRSFSFLFQLLLVSEYLFARVFIIVESFISLRRASVGVFVSPEWIELFPHF